MRLPLFAILPCLLSALGTPVSSQDLTRVDPNRTVEITAHGLCRRVSNNAQSPAMVPHRTAEEWVPTAASSFLSNVPPDMAAVDCVTPEIALRAWSRPGPSGMRGQPIEVDGSAEGLTFTSVGSGMAGSVVSLDGNRILYTPSPDLWRLGNLDEAADEVTFTAIDAEGVLVGGTLKLQLVGYYEGNFVRLVRYYEPGNDPSLEFGFLGELPEETGVGQRMNAIYTTGAKNFDGKLHTFGLVSLGKILSHTILIDTSQASMSPWDGDPVGDLNGDGFSNTILDAQIDAVFRFVDRNAEIAEDGLTPVRLTADLTTYGASEDNEFFIATQRNTADIDPIFLYEMKGGLNYLGLLDVAELNPGQRVRDLLTPLRANEGEAREIVGSTDPGTLIRARLEETGVTREAVAAADGSYLIRFEPSDLPAESGTYPVSVTTFREVSVNGTAPPGSRVLARIPESGAQRRLDIDETGAYEVTFSPEETPRTEDPFSIVVRTTSPLEVTGTGDPGAMIEAFVPDTLASGRAEIGPGGAYRITLPVSALPETDAAYQVLVRTLEAGVSPLSGELIVNGTAPIGSQIRAEIPLTGASRTDIVGASGAYEITFPASETPAGPGDYEVLIRRVSPLEVIGTSDPGAPIRVMVPETGAQVETVADASGDYQVTLPIGSLPDTGAAYEVVTLARNEALITGTTVGLGRVRARIPATDATRTVTADADGTFTITFPPSDLPDTVEPFLAELTYLSYVEGSSPYTHSGTADPGTLVRVTIPETGAVREVTAGWDGLFSARFEPSQLPNTEAPYEVRTLFQAPIYLSGVTAPGGEVRAEIPSTGQALTVSAGPTGAYAITLAPSLLPDTESGFNVDLLFPDGGVALPQAHQVTVSEVDPASSSSLLLRNSISSFTVEPSESALTVSVSSAPSVSAEEVLTISPDLRNIEVTPSTETVQLSIAGNELNLSQVFSELEGQMPGNLENEFAMAIHLLSPGVNSGPDPDMTRFRDQSETGFGAPVFGFYSGPDPASSGAQLLARIDRDGAVRRLGEGGGFGGFVIPDPVIVNVAPLIWDGERKFMRRSDGGVFFVTAERSRTGSRTYQFAYRVMDGEDLTCTSLFCAPEQIPNPRVLTGFDGIDAASGAVNEIGVQFELVRTPGYRVHSDVYADFFNQGGLVLDDIYLNIEGAYEGSPP